MSTFNAFYLRTNDKATLASVSAEFNPLPVEQHGEFIGVRLVEAPAKRPDELMERVSVSFATELIWLGFQSAVDGLEFHHWQVGQQLRGLVFGMGGAERTWQRVEGVPEPWEKNVFFHPRQMAWALQSLEAGAPREAVQRIFKECLLQLGQTEPCVNVKGAALAIASFYGLPHYGLS